MQRANPEAVVILAGGRGARLRHDLPDTPKPLVEIGDRPILWHVIQIYAAQGWRRFLVCVGAGGALVQRFVEGHRWPDGVQVTCLDTGLDTPTGGRILRAAAHLPGQPFFATYADGVADIDLAALVDAHRRGGRLATVTVVRPALPFGVVHLEDGDRVAGFHEKPKSDHWINGGFFALEPEFVEYLDEGSALERQPFKRLASEGNLQAFRHDGFWACVDTYKDALTLDSLWRQGRAPWKLWSG